MRRLSLKTKMTAAVALLVVISLTLLAYGCLVYFEHEIRVTTAVQQLALVSTLGEEIDQKIDLVQQELAAFARTLPRPLLDDPAALQAFLDHGPEPLFDAALAILSPAGVVMAIAPFEAAMVRRDLSFRPYFAATIATGQPQVSAPQTSAQQHGRPVVAFTAPIFMADGRLAAVAVGVVDLLNDNFLGHLARQRLGQEGYLYLFARDRTMIVHPDRQRILRQDVPPGANRLFDRAIEGFEGSGETVTSWGLQAFSSFKQLRTRDWILAANLPVSEALAPIAEARRLLVLALLVCTLVTLLCTWLLMHYFMASLQALTSRIGNLTEAGAGHLSPLPAGDEIHTLIKTFDHLLAETEERKRALLDNLRFHQTLMDTLPTPVFYTDAQERFLGCNRAFEHFIGRKRQELIGRSAIDIPPVERAELYFPGDGDPFRQGQMQVYESQVRNEQSGQMHDVIYYKQAFLTEEGSIGGVIGTFLDITERKRMETDLAEQKEFSEKLLRNSPVACFVVGAGHRVLFWNRACGELTGVPAAQVVGTDEHWRAFYPQRRPCLADLVLTGDGEQAKTFYPQLTAFHLHPESLQAEGWFADLNGHRRYLLFNAAPIRDAGGKVIAAVETLQDLTESKSLEWELQRSRDYYLTILKEFPSLIWRAGLDGKCDYFNQTWLDFTGRSLPEEVGDGWVAGVHAEDRESILRTYGDAFQALRPFAAEYRLRRHDGQYRWILDMGRPIQDLSGNFAGYLGSCYDVTERRANLERLKIFSLAIEQSSSAVIITDADSRIEYVNPEFTRQTGYQPQEAQGANPNTLLNAALSGALGDDGHQSLLQTLCSGQRWTGEFLNRRKDGRLCWNTATLSPIQDETGKISHFVSVMEDVTEKKAAQESQYRRRVMRDAVTEALHAFLQTSSHFAMANTLLSCCLELLQASGGFFAETDAGGRLSFLACAGPGCPPEQEHWEDSMRLRFPELSETGVAPEGIRCLLPLRIGAQELGLLGLYRTEEAFTEMDRQDLDFFASVAALALQSVRAEQARLDAAEYLRTAQKFEAIGQLAGGVAHDFNNLLTIINGYSVQLIKSLAEDDLRRQDAEIVLRAGQKAENLTRQLLAFGRRQVLEPVLFDLNELLGKFRQLLPPLLRADIEVQWHLSEPLDRVKADPDQVEQILVNLVVNARDAMPLGGRLLIETANRQLDEAFVALHPGAISGRYVLLAVHDSGLGMSEEIRRRIFEPFFTTKDQGQGTGLGLSTIYGIIKQSGGYITVESTAGRGSVFQIFLPCCGIIAAEGPALVAGTRRPARPA